MSVKKLRDARSRRYITAHSTHISLKSGLGPRDRRSPSIARAICISVRTSTPAACSASCTKGWACRTRPRVSFRRPEPFN